MRASGDVSEPAIPVRTTILLGLAVALASILGFTHAVRMATHIVGAQARQTYASTLGTQALYTYMSTLAFVWQLPPKVLGVNVLVAQTLCCR